MDNNNDNPNRRGRGRPRNPIYEGLTRAERHREQQRAYRERVRQRQLDYQEALRQEQEYLQEQNRLYELQQRRERNRLANIRYRERLRQQRQEEERQRQLQLEQEYLREQNRIFRNQQKRLRKRQNRIQRQLQRERELNAIQPISQDDNLVINNYKRKSKKRIKKERRRLNDVEPLFNDIVINRDLVRLTDTQRYESDSRNIYVNYHYDIIQYINPFNDVRYTIRDYVNNILELQGSNINNNSIVRFAFYDNNNNTFSTTNSSLQVAINKAASFETQNDYYQGTNINKIIFTIMYPNNRAGASASKSIATANKKWYVLNGKTYKNCAYSACYLATHPDLLNNFIQDPTCLKTHSAKLKQRIKPDKIEYATDDELQLICNYLKRPIILYNNIYQKINTFNPPLRDSKRVESGRKSRAKERPAIEIQLKDNHYLALIPKDSVKIENNEHAEKLEKGENKLNNLEDKVKKIVKFRKYETYNDKIAAWDIETTCIGHNREVKCYAVGFAMYKNGKELYKEFFGLDAQKQFFDWLYAEREMLDGYTLYAHNGGKFDITNTMREYLLYSNNWYIKKPPIELNGSLISLTIESKDDKPYKIKFHDSMKLLSSPLGKLAKDFKVNHQKLTETINHDDITIHNFNNIPELKTYLKHDCLSLLEICDSFSKTVYEMSYAKSKIYDKKKKKYVNVEGGLNITNIMTGASLAKQLFFNRYYNVNKYPVYTLTDKIDAFIRDGYFGGRVEISYLGLVDKPLYYLDFTSLYPWCGLKNLPYGKPVYTDLKHSNVFPKGFFGFIRCLVKTKNKNLKPVHGDKQEGKLCFRIHEDWTELTLFSEEIKYAMSKDMYDYQFIDGYDFVEAPFMKDVFNDCFNNKALAKSQGKKALSLAWKIILNSLYGFWGLKTKDRDSVKIYPKGDSAVFDYLQKDKLINEADIGNYTILRVLQDLDTKDFNVGVASAISSYGRIRLTQLIHDIEERGYKVYMNDTDSIVTDCNINKYPDMMKKYMWDGCGDDFGALKNEADEPVMEMLDKNQYENLKQLENGLISFDRGIFAGCKFYSLEKKLDNGNVIDITKCKGWKKEKDKELKFKDMMKLLTNKDDVDKLMKDLTQQYNEGEIDYEEYQKCLNDAGVLVQTQKQFRLPKSSMVSETDTFKMTIPSITKSFKKIYTKGEVLKDGNIIPLTNK